MQVVLIAAQSLDGFITRHDTPGAGFTSQADKVWFKTALREFDCSVLGAGSYRAERDMFLASRAPGRRRVVMTRRPEQFASDAVGGILEFTDEPPRAILRRLEDAGHTRCALLGGAQIHRLFLAEGLVDELWITVEPRLFGRGTPLVGGECDLALALIGSERIGPDTLLLRYALRR